VTGLRVIHPAGGAYAAGFGQVHDLWTSATNDSKFSFQETSE